MEHSISNLILEQILYVVLWLTIIVPLIAACTYIPPKFDGFRNIIRNKYFVPILIGATLGIVIDVLIDFFSHHMDLVANFIYDLDNPESILYAKLIAAALFVFIASAIINVALSFRKKK